MDLTTYLMLITGVGIAGYFGYKYVDDLANYVNINQKSPRVSGYLYTLLLPICLTLAITCTVDHLPDVVITFLMGTALFVSVLYIGWSNIKKQQQLPASTSQLALWPIILVVLLWIICYDRIITLSDGIILIIFGLIWFLTTSTLAKKNRELGELLSVNLIPRRQVVPIFSSSQAVFIWLGTLLAIAIGSELIAYNLQLFVANSGLTATVFGATVVALVCTLTIIWRNYHDVTRPSATTIVRDGYTAPIVLTSFYLGIAALFNNIRVDKLVFQYYLPILTLGLILTAITLYRHKTERYIGWAYCVLAICYLLVGFIVK